MSTITEIKETKIKLLYQRLDELNIKRKEHRTKMLNYEQRMEIVRGNIAELKSKEDILKILEFLKSKKDWTTAVEIANKVNFESGGKYFGDLLEIMVKTSRVVRSHQGYSIKNRK